MADPCQNVRKSALASKPRNRSPRLGILQPCRFAHTEAAGRILVYRVWGTRGPEFKSRRPDESPGNRGFSIERPKAPVSPAEPRYRLGMAENTRADASDAISRLADSSGKAILNLVTLPLRMFIGAVDILETQVHKERVVELERRLDSLEQQGTGRRQSSGARQ